MKQAHTFKKRLKVYFAGALLVFLFAMQSSCATDEPLPAPVPADQVIESALQIRITKSGLNKIEALIPETINAQFANGFCAESDTSSGFGGTLTVCGENSCPGGARGCRIDAQLNSMNFSILNEHQYQIDSHVAVQTSVRVELDLGILGTHGCTFELHADDVFFAVSLHLDTLPSNGELISWTTTDAASVAGFGIDGCGVLGDVVGFLIGSFQGWVDEKISNALRDSLDEIANLVLPIPEAMSGLIRLANDSEDPRHGSPNLEMKIAPGGHAGFFSEGISFGVIAGMNSDFNKESRAPENDSETNPCVPSYPAPIQDLPMTDRQTFFLPPAAIFRGEPDVEGDLVFGVSEKFLNLIGHHLFASGALCRRSTMDATLGALGFLFPAIHNFGSGGEPAKLELRPQRPLAFTVGDGSAENPHMTVHVRDLEVDIYIRIFGRFTRVFTLSLNLQVGLTLRVEALGAGDYQVTPIVGGIDEIEFTFKNASMVTTNTVQSDEALHELFQNLISTVIPDVAPIPLPKPTGFFLSSFGITMYENDYDRFLILYVGIEPESDVIFAPAPRFQVEETL